MLSLALLYAVNGVRVFPCRECRYHGMSEKSPYVAQGFHAASSNSFQIKTWWARWPNAVVGLPCELNDLIVLDADRHGGDDGVHNLSLMLQKFECDTSTIPCVETPRQGLHLLFQRPSAMGATRGRLASAVDIRDKAYIIAAGSNLKASGCYRLTNGSIDELASAIGRRQLPMPPGWLQSLLVKDEVRRGRPYGLDTRFAADVQYGDVRRRIAGLARSVAEARTGERNATLFWAVCRAAELINAGLISSDAALAALAASGSVCGLRDSEVRATIKSGLTATGASHGW